MFVWGSCEGDECRQFRWVFFAPLGPGGIDEATILCPNKWESQTMMKRIIQ